MVLKWGEYSTGGFGGCTIDVYEVTDCKIYTTANVLKEDSTTLCDNLFVFNPDKDVRTITIIPPTDDGDLAATQGTVIFTVSGYN